MDIDDELEMVRTILTSHAISTTELDEHLVKITCLVCLLSEINSTRVGGLNPGKRKKKNQKQMESHLALYQDYYRRCHRLEYSDLRKTLSKLCKQLSKEVPYKGKSFISTSRIFSQKS